jgi:hypothetical protein
LLQTGRRLAELTLWSVFFGYAEEYLVDVKFVRERIGTLLFDYLVGAGEWHRRRVETFGLALFHIWSAAGAMS